MAKNNFNFKTFFNAGDLLAVLVIIAGILIAVFLDDIAIKMIGFSVALLGILALFMLISGRLSDIVDSKAIKKTNIKEYEVTTVVDSKATRKTIENYQFEDDGLAPFPDNDNQEFKVKDKNLSISKTIDKDFKKTSEENKSNSPNSEIVNPEKPQVEKALQFADATSSVRILGTIKKKPIDDKLNNTEDKIDIIKDNDNKVIVRDPNSINEENVLNKNTVQDNHKITNENNQINKNQDLQKEQLNSGNSKDKIEIPTNYFFETDMLIGEEPKLEFEYFISRILIIIKSVTDSNSALLVLVDNKFENFSIESFTTDKDKTIDSKRKYAVSNDIISQIIKNAKPEILSEINPAALKDLIPYYTNDIHVESFIGIPVIWNDLVIGVMCADSVNKDCFDSATVSFMGQFSKLISGLVKSYTHKIDLLQAAKTLEVINKFQNIVLSEQISKENLNSMIIDEIKRMFQGYVVGIASYNYDNENWSIDIYDDGKHRINNIEIDFSTSLIGKCIIDGETIYLSGIELVNIKRVFSKEQKYLSGEFLATPLRTNNGIYGAIFIESTPLERLTDFDISILQVLSNHLAVTLERFNLINLYRSSCIVDRVTGLYNNTAFYQRLNEEIDRIEEIEASQLTLCLFRVDKYASLDPQIYSDRLEMAVSNAIDIAKKYTKKYEIMGRIDSDTYAIIFINHNNNDIKLIAERFRNDVANSIIEFDNTKFSVTISIGLASYQKRIGVNGLVSNAINALTKSLQFTNHVQLYK